MWNAANKFNKVGDTELKLDLARPAEGEGPFPAVLVIHGRCGARQQERLAGAQ